VALPEPTKSLAKDAASQRAASDTHPLPQASDAFAPLPKGALLREGQYVVLEERAANERSNVYLVEDSVPVRVCPNCQEEASDPEEQFCPYCGADLSDVSPLHLRYLMRERADERAFATEAQLLGMHLEQPGLLLPHAVFVEAPYGPNRSYRAEPEFTPPLATTLSVPQELNQVLAWGVSLAQALDYLHRHQIALNGAGLDHIAVEDKQAHWTNLGAARIIPAAERSKAQNWFSQDVRSLAEALLYLATGKRRYTPDLSLPEQVAAPLSRALNAPQAISTSDFAAALASAQEALRRPSSVTLLVGQRTDVGQERSLNEDSMLTLDIAPVLRSVSRPVGLFVVADGMGGHQAGDLASRQTIRTVAQRAVDEVLSAAAAGAQLPNIREWLTAATQAANQAVYEQRRAAGSDMGTTLTMALFVGDTATIANVGDSRAYLLTEDGITQITTDHSLVERLIATDQITREEAVNHPQRNVIYRVIGDKPGLEVDLFEQRLRPGQAILLCSDGLSGMVSDEKIWQTWRTSTSPQEACDRLVEAANRAGGEDNITIIIAQNTH
jgi:protein phosphatase